MQLSRDEIVEQINTLLADNSHQLITPQRLRTILLNILDSVVHKDDNPPLDQPSIEP